MNFSEFKNVFKSLEMAFSRDLKSDQIEFFFDKFREWPTKKIKWVVDSLVQDSERFPTIASIFKKGAEYREDVTVGSSKIQCGFCDSKGAVTAHYPPPEQNYTCAFKCPYCENGPVQNVEKWGIVPESKGYKLTWHYADRKKPGSDTIRVSNQEVSKITQMVKSVFSEPLPKFGNKEWVRKRELSKDKERDFEGYDSF